MSVLDQNLPSRFNSAQEVANQLKQNAKNTFRNLVGSYNANARLFWSNPAFTPNQIAAALGTDAAELFQLHAKIGELLASVKPDSVTQVLALVQPFTVNEDGTVTISDSPQT